MKSIQYGKVTSVFKDDAYGAQLCNVKGSLTDREYQNCEILSIKGVNTLPVVGDTVALIEMHNSELLVLGVVETQDLELEEGEILVWKGDKDSLSIKINKDQEIVVKTPVKVRIEAPLVEII